VGVKSGMHLFGMDISTLVNSILLTIVYFIGIGITSMVALISKKKFLRTRPTGKTYWQDNETTKDPEALYRQF
jgi:hypothetical protein